MYVSGALDYMYIVRIIVTASLFGIDVRTAAGNLEGHQHV